MSFRTPDDALRAPNKVGYERSHHAGYAAKRGEMRTYDDRPDLRRPDELDVRSSGTEYGKGRGEPISARASAHDHHGQ